MKFLTLILAAVMTLAFSLPAEAAVSKLNRCKAQVTRAERKYATCVSGTAARALRLGYDTDSSTYQECDNRRGGALTRIAEKFPSLPEADCGLDTASSDARAQAALVVAGLARTGVPSERNIVYATRTSCISAVNCKLLPQVTSRSSGRCKSGSTRAISLSESVIPVTDSPVS